MALFLICAVLTGGGFVWAQLPGDSPRGGKFGVGGGGFEGFENTAIEYLHSFDADGDGMISRAEFLKAFEAMFQIMDVSGDGKLDNEEIRRDPARVYGERARWAAQIIERYDADGDDKVSAEEAPFGAIAFGRADANKDGRLDRRDLTQFAFDLALLSDALRMADYPARVAQAFLKKYDKNRDGKIAPDEFEWGEEMFARFDRNGDKMLDPDELGRIPPLPPSPKSQAKDIIKQRDKDGDGRLSAAEFGDTPERFHAADLNGDGQVTLEELTASIAQSLAVGKEGRGGKRLDIAPDRPVKPMEGPAQPAGLVPNKAVPKPGAGAPAPAPGALRVKPLALPAPAAKPTTPTALVAPAAW
jgi:Ca2+-binding EF-hand superfamily protein